MSVPPIHGALLPIPPHLSPSETSSSQATAAFSSSSSSSTLSLLPSPHRAPLSSLPAYGRKPSLASGLLLGRAVKIRENSPLAQLSACLPLPAPTPTVLSQGGVGEVRGWNTAGPGGQWSSQWHTLAGGLSSHVQFWKMQVGRGLPRHLPGPAVCQPLSSLGPSWRSTVRAGAGQADK